MIFGGSIRSHLLAFFSSEGEDAEATTAQLTISAKKFKGQVLIRELPLSLVH